MIIPVDKMVNHSDNVYELTCAAIRRAMQITITGDEDVQENGGKVVSTALKQILDHKVEYQLEDQ
ncbi:MAG: DNA-directed RNA polymerase subunit omega [Spirochaetales bacterium]|nr:DNA-directed RNA polymerase subunit omega [Spirochaetales bacterium]